MHKNELKHLPLCINGFDLKVDLVSFFLVAFIFIKYELLIEKVVLEPKGNS